MGTSGKKDLVADALTRIIHTISIVNCEYLAETESGFCYDCKKYPCTRLKNLDKRFRTKYRMSMIDNLEYIENWGLKKFVESEQKRWKSRECGEIICVHRTTCLKCGAEWA